MQLVKDCIEMQELAWSKRSSGLKTALVPTMGYFHAGHLSLMRWARENADFVITSLFVNPTQFGPNEDLSSYPRDFDRDFALAEKEGVDILFAPDVEDIYDPKHLTWVEVTELDQGLCGQSRPHHFRGVCTVVCKLFNLTLPVIAVFGEKDWQQLAIIRKMTEDLNLPVRIVGRPIVREPDGLAMSSRNAYLTPEERQLAPNIYAGLLEAKAWVQEGIVAASKILGRLNDFYRQKIPAGQIDYLELVEGKSLQSIDRVCAGALLAVAIYLGQARLIDNILLIPEE